MSTIPVSSDVPKMPPQSAEMITVEAHPQLRLQRAPEEVLREASLAAKALRDLVESKPKKVVLNGKTFLQFEDWLTVARFYGITVASRATNYVERGRVQGYECHAEAILVATNQVIGAGQAECLDDEKNWNMRPVYRDGRCVGEEKVPLFQLRSMAQTRAQAKALRSILAWVVVLAGYAPTPAEEMDGNSRNFPSNSRKSEGISRDQLEEGVNDLRTAQSTEQLKKIFTYWYRKASAAGDHHAQAVFIQVKDTRKKALL